MLGLSRATTLSRVKDGIGEAVTNVGNIVRKIARYICIFVMLKRVVLPCGIVVLLPMIN
jgi:hypothetical protein